MKCNSLVEKFNTLKSRREGALITYFPMGDGGIDPVRLARLFIECGVDVLEVGYPVKNPYLDGKVIAESMGRALAAPGGARDFFENLSLVHEAFPDTPLEVFTYAEAISQLGMKEFTEQCCSHGADAILLAGSDALLQQAVDACVPPGLINIRFMPYRHSSEDVAAVREKAEGFVFLQATDGGTGMRGEIDPNIGKKLSRLKRDLPDVPICPGFGISVAEHCRTYRDMGADGVIVGSAVVNMLQSASLADTGAFLSRLKRQLV